MTAILRFMDSPATTGTVRLDLNPDSTFFPASDFDPGNPSLEGDPDGVGVEYGFRTVKWTQVIRDTKANAAAHRQALARELVRRENWLQFQLDASSTPVWFRTYLTEPPSLSLENVYDDGGLPIPDTWQIAVSLTAGPFAYGARVTLSALTIPHDPTATNGVVVTLPAIIGDVPAPLRLLVDPPQANERIVVATSVNGQGASLGDPYLSTDANTVDSSVVTDTTGVSGAPVRTTFATTTTTASRAVVTLPKGRLRAYVRMRAVSANSTVGLRLKVSGSSPAAYFTDEKQAAVTTAWQWVDLGTFAAPYGIPWGADQAATFPDASGTTNAYIDARQISGSGGVDFDAVFCLPVVGMTNSASPIIGQGMLEYSIAGHAINTGYLTFFDGDWETGAVVTPKGSLYPDQFYPVASNNGPSRPVRGGFPVAVPGEQNRLYLLRQLLGSTSANDKTASSTVTVSYLPRYLWIA